MIPARAQELSLLGGVTDEGSLYGTTYGWYINYEHMLGEHTYFSLGWINEGHLDNGGLFLSKFRHRRDGPVIQIGGRVTSPQQHLSLSLGFGLYAYSDTAFTEEGGVSYTNDHGTGLIYSVGLSWYFSLPWFFNLHTNRIVTDTHFNTTQYLFGIGYQLDSPNALTQSLKSEPHIDHNEITVFIGHTVLNSFQSENSLALSAEYRRGVRRYIDWTIAWLHEGGQHIIRQDGITTQLWAVGSYLHDRFGLGVGAGTYIVVDKDKPTDNNTNDVNKQVYAIVTMTASYHFDRHWMVRLNFNRIITDYHHDADIVLIGSGYRF